VSSRDREKSTLREPTKPQRPSRYGTARRSYSQQRRARLANEAYKKKVDEQLFGTRGDTTQGRLEERLRAAQGSPGFMRMYREYVRDYGMPSDWNTLLSLLDLDDEREGLRVLRALAASVPSVTPQQKSLLRGRLRNLEMSTSHDAIADAAVDLLARL
jgi:hypothetical protein